MNRRDFVGGSLGASLLPALGRAEASENALPPNPSPGPRPYLFELRLYRLRLGPMPARFGEYAKRVLVPALNRVGIKPVGAFSVAFGVEGPSVYLLLPHATAESVLTLDARLQADAEYQKAVAPYRLPATDPLIDRVDSSLMVAFDSMRAIEVPTGAAAPTSRVFELRTYQSHSRAANRKKIEMFESAGEIAIFRRVGLTPVFFARNLIGPGLPSLTYMLVFPDLATREKNWAVFSEDPEWVKLRSTAGFTNAEIVTHTQVTVLRPTDYSQV